jgi:hypothetical protein
MDSSNGAAIEIKRPSTIRSREIDAYCVTEFQGNAVLL